MAVKDNLYGGGQKATYYLTGNTRINIAYSGKVVKAKLLSSPYLGDVEVEINRANSDVDYVPSSSSLLNTITLNQRNIEGQYKVDKKENSYLVFSLHATYSYWDNLNNSNVAKVEIVIE